MDSAVEIKRRVWRRDGGKCTACGSTHALEYDHIRPRAAGGETSFENLRLLCKNCNLRAAMSYYGDSKINSFVRDVDRAYAA